MRIAILNWRDSVHPEAGGAELYCESVARELAQLGDDVTLVTSRPGGARRSDQTDAYTIVRGGGRYTVYLFVLFWLLRNRRKLDGVVDSQNGIPFFSPLALPRRLPIVLLMHHVHQEQFGLYFPAPIATLGRWLEATGARVAYGRRAIAAVSPSTRSAVRRRLRLRGPITLAPCGLEPVSKLETERSNSPRLVAVGRLAPHKQIHLLIEAMPEIIRQVPSAELHVVGDGIERDYLEKLAAGLGITDRVTFHGRVPATVRDKLVAASWLEVNTSQGEGWGLSVMEANQQGVPALAFRVEGLRDSILDGRTGWLVDRNQDLADAISVALISLRDIDYSNRVGLSAVSWAAGFTWKNTATSLRNLLLAERRRLARATDRREPSDLMTIVEIDDKAVPSDWSPTLRAGDMVHRLGSRHRLLLFGLDDREAITLLRRCHISDESITHGLVRISIASSQDALLFAAGLRESQDEGDSLTLMRTIREREPIGFAGSSIEFPLDEPTNRSGGSAHGTAAGLIN